MIAAGVVAVLGVTLVVGGFASGTERAAGDSVAPFVLVAGAAVPYDRPQPWTDASVPSPASRELTVFATGSTDSGGSACGPPVLRFRVTETDRTVRVLVAGYQAPAHVGLACAAVGYLPSPHTVQLDRPLGSRVVVDASTGRRAALIDGAQHPDLVAPSGLRATPVRRWDAGGPTTRTWIAPGTYEPTAISLTDQSPASVRTNGPYGRVALQTDVRGTPATVYEGVGSDPGTWFVQWTPNERQTITVRVAAAAGRRWTAASTLALARTVTRYATARTGRLGQPSVGGTVAATYNSADGPLTDVTNLLKSSGVHVGVDCIGAGRLSVTVRGRITELRCTATLGHHEFTSTGSAFDPFPTTVTAAAGVRWSLSLARASLDGS